MTIVKRDVITAHVRCRGGRTETLTIPIPLNAWQEKQTDPRVLEEMDRLLDEHTDGEMAALLRERGMRTGAGEAFTSRSVKWARRRWGLESLRERLHDSGMLTIEEMADALGITTHMVKAWRVKGILDARKSDDKGAWLYVPPDDALLATERTRPRRGSCASRSATDVSTLALARLPIHSRWRRPGASGR